MVDTKQWVERIEEAFTSVAPNDVPDSVRLNALKMSMLELMRGAYTDGLQDATNATEKRRLVTMLVAANPTATVHTVEVEAAAGIVEQIYNTVK